jgi:hypothetical protein
VVASQKPLAFIFFVGFEANILVQDLPAQTFDGTATPQTHFYSVRKVCKSRL